MIDDRRLVTDQLADLARRLEALAGWMATPTEPFPVDAVELGEFTGRVAVMLIAGGSAPGDGSPIAAEGS